MDDVPRSTSADLAFAILEHNKIPGLAPPGCGLIAAHWRPHWAEAHVSDHDEKITMATLTELGKVMPEISNAVVFAEVVRYNPCCLPIRSAGAFRALGEQFGSVPSASRIALAGDYFGLASTNTAAASGELAARRLVRFISTGS